MHAGAQEVAQATRTCAVCALVKPVSGVWYLLPPHRRSADSRFVCESCFRTKPPLAEALP